MITHRKKVQEDYKKRREAIRKQYHDGVKVSSLAVLYGISRQRIWKIVNHKEK